MMFKTIEESSAGTNRGAGDKVFLAVTTLLAALFTYAFVFEPGIITHPAEHRLFNLIFRLGVIGFAFLSLKRTKYLHSN